MARTRLMVHMTKGDPHVLDFDDEASAKAALDELQEPLGYPPGKAQYPITVADRLVVKPADVRSAELVEPPSFGFA